METIEIDQRLKRTGPRSYQVKMIVKQNNLTEVYEFNFSNSNAIYPLYKSLIHVVRLFNNVHITLKTQNKVFVGEVNGQAGKNARLFNILNDEKQEKGVSIDAVFVEKNKLNRGNIGNDNENVQ